MGLYAFDGTWQDSQEQHSTSKTNVARFHDLYEGHHESFYAAGSGTSFGLGRDLFALVGRGLGAAGGLGTDLCVRQAYSSLCRACLQGDCDIDIVGYSRGAATALVFAWHVSQEGIRHPESGEKLKITPKIRFLGLWDSVFFIMGTRGLPETERLKTVLVRYPLVQRLFSRKFIEESGTPDFRLPAIVEQAFHALALHERRWAYLPVRIEKAREVWLVGEHADVGGGGEKKQLSDISLHWMIEKAQKCGVPVSSMDAPVHQEYHQLGDDFAWGKWARKLRAGDLMHVSVRQLAGGAAETISGLTVESDKNSAA